MVKWKGNEEKNRSGIDESEPVRINKEDIKSKRSAKRGGLP